MTQVLAREVERLAPGEGRNVVSVLSEAFHEYPVMRYVLGESEDFVARNERLISFFVMTRVLRDEPVLGIRGPDGELLGAALASTPRPAASPPEVSELREFTWAALGADARRRYETYGAATEANAVAGFHLHLNMIGVRRQAQGLGLGRRLLDAVHALSVADPLSTGVSLTTEVPSNVELYRHVGYDVIGATDVDGGFTTWGMFRPDR